ncbi:MAG: hypothetical protein M3380_00795 [Chloroflexota bacterium]|nr:hypothetical protein [Chloroflexota bacterium]
MLPARVRTYAPRGHTPLLRVPLTRDHLSAISAVTADGRVFMQVQPQAYRSQHVVRFLRHLLRHIAGKVLIIWDGSPSIAVTPSRRFWPAVVQNGSIWNDCLAMPRTSTRLKGSGAT